MQKLKHVINVLNILVKSWCARDVVAFIQEQIEHDITLVIIVG